MAEQPQTSVLVSIPRVIVLPSPLLYLYHHDDDYHHYGTPSALSAR